MSAHFTDSPWHLAGLCSRTHSSSVIFTQRDIRGLGEEGGLTAEHETVEVLIFDMVKHFPLSVSLFLTYSSSSFTQLAVPLTCVVLPSQSTQLRPNYERLLWLNGEKFEKDKHWFPEPKCAHPRCQAKSCSVQYKCFGCDGSVIQPWWFGPDG